MTTQRRKLRQYAVARLRGAAAPIVGRAETTRVVEVSVVSGLQAGASIKFDHSDFSIGPDLDDDVMLLDDSAASTRASVSVEPTIFGTLASIAVSEGRLQVDGEAATADRAHPPVRLPCSLTIGVVSLKLDVRRRNPARRRSPAWIKGAAAASCAGFVLASALYLWPPKINPTLSFEAAGVRLSTTRETPAPLLHSIAANQIAETRLADYLTVAATDGGWIDISGTIPAKLMPQWRRTRQLIDKESGGAPIVSSVKAAPMLDRLPPIAAVQLGAHPRIYFTTGRQAQIGEIIVDGWKIRSIEADALGLSRGKEALVIEF